MKKIILGIIILILITVFIFTFLGYFKNKKNEKKLTFIEVPEGTSTPISIPSFPSMSFIQPLEQTSSQATTSLNQSFQILFNQELLYLDLDYPLLYIYDPKEEVIKYIDLENESYKEIYKISNLKNAFLSPDKEKIILETEEGTFQLLNLKNDTLENLPPFIRNFAFSSKGVIIYLNNNKTISSLVYFHNGKDITIRNLGLLNPEIVPFNNSLLIYEKNSPVFILDLNKPNNLNIFLEEKENYSILVNKNNDLIFVSFKENAWQSEILDRNKKIKVTFSWGTIKEKCSFDDILICAVPMNLENFDPENWYLFEPSYDEKFIIYDTKKNEIKEIKLMGRFDVFKPKLTPLGIIFWNRLDAKFYLIKFK